MSKILAYQQQHFNEENLRNYFSVKHWIVFMHKAQFYHKCNNVQFVKT